MNNNNASTSRMKIVVGGITFEIEGTEALVKEGMSYAKENVLTESAREAAKQFLTQEEKPSEKPTREVPEITNYYNEKDPRTDIERVTVLTCYAKEYRGILEVSDKEVAPLFNEVGGKLPKNVMQAIRNAARKDYGYLEYAGKSGYYRVTNAGINLVKRLPRSKK